MRYLIFIMAIMLTACTTAPKAFDNQFARTEIAAYVAKDFGADQGAAARALKPTYKKYGAPHVYISGHMSSVNVHGLNRLYGSGDVITKLRLKAHTFWSIDGADLVGYYTPIKTAHLVYDMDQLDGLTDVLDSVGQLSKRGQAFTVFEREVDRQIVVTLHRTEDLPVDSTLDQLTFFKG